MTVITLIHIPKLYNQLQDYANTEGHLEGRLLYKKNWDMRSVDYSQIFVFEKRGPFPIDLFVQSCGTPPLSSVSWATICQSSHYFVTHYYQLKLCFSDFCKLFVLHTWRIKATAMILGSWVKWAPLVLWFCQKIEGTCNFLYTKGAHRQ